MRALVAIAVLALVGTIAGCEQDSETSTPADSPPAEEQAEQPEEPEEPAYTSWQVYVNDEDSYDQDGITYTIALNLTATNPTPDIAGTYTGSATASTSSIGTYQGMELNASAIANSSTLTFELADAAAGGALAPITDQALAEYAGGGSIVMEASGGGTYGPAGGSFSNTSGQNLRISVSGSTVTMRVTISGHEYTFTGTISGQ
jgi:hypothetical protein